LNKYINIKKIPRMKTFSNEVGGTFSVLSFPNGPIEFFWTLCLFPVRLYIWALVFYQTKIKRQHYKDSWKRVESTK
ncbi:MAG: hypothetical protein AABY22_11105, partial [Nanoarchaeota archaeon]